MKQRIITALILAPLAIAGIFFLPLKFFMLFAATIYLLASKEWGGFVNKKQPTPVLYVFGLALGITLIFIPIDLVWLDGEVNNIMSYGLLGAVVWWAISLLMVVTYPKTAPAWRHNSVFKYLFGLLTLVPFFWGMVLLRSANIDSDFYYGAELLMFVFLLVWAADTGAYFSGKAFGKHKLAPNVSPGKTIEGFVGGLVWAMAITAGAAWFFDIAFSKLPLFFLAALITTVASALGDLSESIFKREAGLKDSGNLLPGHGGILDRIDSLTAAVPVFAFIYLVGIA